MSSLLYPPTDFIVTGVISSHYFPPCIGHLSTCGIHLNTNEVKMEIDGNSVSFARVHVYS